MIFKIVKKSKHILIKNERVIKKTVLFFVYNGEKMEKDVEFLLF